MTVENIREEVRAARVRSAWARGVQAYAVDLLDGVEAVPSTWEQLRALLLNGAADWKQYSMGGCALVCASDIVRRLCTSFEQMAVLDLGGNVVYGPNSRETWLDVQARALCQASAMVRDAFERCWIEESGDGVAIVQH